MVKETIRNQNKQAPAVQNGGGLFTSKDEECGCGEAAVG